MNTDSLKPERKRGQFLLLLAIFLMPVLTAYAVYFLFPGLRPHATTNYGQLLPQARALPPLDLHDAAGKPAGPGLFKGKWSMVYIGGADCAEACRTEIHLSRQVRTALALNARRLQRLYIAPDPQALATATALFAPEHPDLLLLADAGVPGQRAADFFQPGAADALYLVDPLGNWFMLYPPRADQAADFKGIGKDLKKLLNQSQVD
jgi:hypothetical protein